MAFLTLNGLQVSPLFGKTARTDPEIGQGATRTGDGTLLTDNRAIKTEFTSEAVIDTQANIHALRRLLRGEWDHWTFSAATGFYSDLAVPTLSVTNASQVSSGGKVAPGVLDMGGTTGSIEWANVIANVGGATWSLLAWQKALGTWAHYVVVVSAGTCIQVLLNGATQAATLPAWVSSDVANLGLHLTNTAAGDVLYNDLVVFPFALPTAWGAQFYTWMLTNAWTQAPQLQTGGDFGSLLIKGVDAGSVLDQVGLGGVWNTNAEHLSMGLRGT